MLAGFAILRSIDGQWWGVGLWVLVSPLIYLVVDFLFFGRTRRASDADARRPRRLERPQTRPATTPRPAGQPPDWASAQKPSTGSEILERGRRYDRRRA